MRKKIINNILLGLKIADIIVASGIIAMLVFYAIREEIPFDTTLFQSKPTASIHKLSLKDFKIFWEGELLEKKEASMPVVSYPTEIPFVWIGSILYSEEKNSFIILSEKNKATQILLRQGDSIPKTNYKILSITKDLVKISDGKNIFHLTKPEPGKNLVVKESEGKEGLTKEAPREISVFSNDTKELRVLAKSEMTGYGIQENDKIIGVGRQRIKNLEEFEEAILANRNKSAMIVSVIREGRVITVVLPTSTIAELLKKK